MSRREASRWRGSPLTYTWMLPLLFFVRSVTILKCFYSRAKTHEHCHPGYHSAFIPSSLTWRATWYRRYHFLGRGGFRVLVGYHDGGRYYRTLANPKLRTYNKEGYAGYLPHNRRGEFTRPHPEQGTIFSRARVWDFLQ